jgi:hypothetical protein
MIDRESRNKLLEELHMEAWKHAIAGQKLLSRIRDLETMFKAEDVKEDRKQHEN